MTAAAPDGRFLTFFVGDERFAVNAADVIEIFRPPPLTRVPNAPPSLMGIGSLRGVPAPVVSLARLLGREDRITADFRLLLVEAGQAVGLAVDRVGSLTRLPEGATADGRLYLLDDEEGVRPLDLDALLRRDFTARPAPVLPRATRSAAAPKAAPRTELSFLAFELTGQLYALPIDEVAGVQALPPSLTTVAQSDEAVLGIVPLRDRLLPIVSLRRLLGLPPEQTAGKVVIARIGGSSVGLAVDRVQAILRVPEESIDPAPAVLNRGAGEAQIRSICRLPGNKGLVALLSSERLFREAAIARILAEGQKESGAMKSAAKDDRAERFLIFRLNDEEYGLPLAAIDEVVRLPSQLTRIPNAPAFVQGIMPLRGKAIPVIDPRLRFASGDAKDDIRPRIVVTSIEGRKAGFIVDSAAEIIAIAPDSISATPEMAAEAGKLFSRIASLEEGNRLILLIEPKEMLEKAEQDLLARLDAAMTAAPQ